MVLMEVSGVYTNSKSAYPQVVLKEKGGNSYLPIVIGRFEATAISMAQNGRKPVRPISYDLAYTILGTVDAQVEKVAITDLHEGTYYAQVHLRDEEGETAVLDSRPSDAIALALRMGAPIFASPGVLKEAGYVRPEEPAEAAQAAASAVVENPKTASGKAADIHILEDIRTGQLQDSGSVDRLELLRRRLRQAVAEEVYEEAARLRDEISRLEKEGDSP